MSREPLRYKDHIVIMIQSYQININSDGSPAEFLEDLMPEIRYAAACPATGFITIEEDTLEDLKAHIDEEASR